MGILVKDYEKVIFNTQDEIAGYVSYRNDNDLWVETQICDCKVVALEEGDDISSYSLHLTSENAIKSAMAENAFFLTFSNNDLTCIVPVRYTGEESLFNRAGIGGCTIHNTVEKGNVSVLPKSEKAEILTKFLSLYKSKTRILIRDEKASFLASECYSILREKELYDIIVDVIDLQYPMNEFKEGSASHELLRFDFKFNDEDMELDLENRIKSNVGYVSSVESGFTFYTSDIGESSACVFPYFLINGNRKLCCGAPISVKHIGKNNTKDFEKAVRKMNKLFQSNAQHFEKLSEMEIKHSKHCLANVAKALKLPKKLTLSIIDNIAECENFTGFDIYWNLCEIVNLYNESAKEVTRSLYYQEVVARSISLDFTQFDNVYDL